MGATFLGLALAQQVSQSSRSFGFFLLPTRGWEILIGALVAFYLFTNENTSTKNKIVAQGASLIGFISIIYSVFVFNKLTPFPSLFALIPTLGTALIILFATPQTVIGQALGSRALVGIGLISYSSYLWHQPLFAFARHRSFEDPSKGVLLALAALSLILGFLNWKLIETPFRNRKRFRRNQIFAGAAIGSLFFLTVGLVGNFSGGFKNRTPFLAEMAAIKTIKESRCHTSGRKTASQLSHGEFCGLGTAKIPSFAVIGDSHAGAIFETMNSFKTDSPFYFYAVSSGFCAPLLNNFKLNRYTAEDCQETTQEAIQQILKTGTIQTIVLFAEWANYTKGYRDSPTVNAPALAQDADGSALTTAENPVIFERSLQKTIATLISAGKKVIIVLPTPEFDRPVISTISKRILFGDSVENIPLFAPTVPVAEYNVRNAEVMSAFKRLENVTFVQTSEIFCSTEICRSVDPHGTILFSDSNHLSEAGAKLLVNKIMALLTIK